MWLAIVIQMASGSNARRLARSTFRFHTFLLFPFVSSSLFLIENIRSHWNRMGIGFLRWLLGCVNQMTTHYFG